MIKESKAEPKAEAKAQPEQAAPPAEEKPAASVPAWEDEKPATEEPATSGPTLAAQVAEKKTVEDLKTLWVENKAAFDADAELFATYKARGKAILAGDA